MRAPLHAPPPPACGARHRAPRQRVSVRAVRGGTASGRAPCPDRAARREAPAGSSRDFAWEGAAVRRVRRSRRGRGIIDFASNGMESCPHVPPRRLHADATFSKDQVTALEKILGVKLPEQGFTLRSPPSSPASTRASWTAWSVVSFPRSRSRWRAMAPCARPSSSSRPCVGAPRSSRAVTRPRLPRP